MAIHRDKFETGDFDSWLGLFERCATASAWGDTQKLNKLPAYLKGDAEKYYALLTTAGKETFFKPLQIFYSFGLP